MSKKIGGFIIQKNSKKAPTIDSTNSTQPSSAASNTKAVNTTRFNDTDDLDDDNYLTNQKNSTTTTFSSPSPSVFNPALFSSLQTAPRHVISNPMYYNVPYSKGNNDDEDDNDDDDINIRNSSFNNSRNTNRDRPMTFCALCQKMQPHKPGPSCPHFRSFVCRNWKNNLSCSRGITCNYSHPIESLTYSQAEKLLREMDAELRDGSTAIRNSDDNFDGSYQLCGTYCASPAVLAIAAANDGDCLVPLLRNEFSLNNNNCNDENRTPPIFYHSAIISGIPDERQAAGQNIDERLLSQWEPRFHRRNVNKLRDKRIFQGLVSHLKEQFPSLIYLHVSPSSTSSINIRNQSFTTALMIVKDKNDLLQKQRRFDTSLRGGRGGRGRGRGSNNTNNKTRGRGGVTISESPSPSASASSSPSSFVTETSTVLKFVYCDLTSSGKDTFVLKYTFDNDDDNSNDDTTAKRISSNHAINDTKRELFTENIALLSKVQQFIDHRSKRELMSFCLISKAALETFISNRALSLMSYAKQVNNNNTKLVSSLPTVPTIADSLFSQVLRMARVIPPQQLQYFLGTLQSIVQIPPEQFLRSALKSSSRYIFHQVFLKFVREIEFPIALASGLSENVDDTSNTYFSDIMKMTKPCIGWIKTKKKQNSSEETAAVDANKIENEEGKSYSADELEFVVVDPMSGEERPQLNPVHIKQIKRTHEHLSSSIFDFSSTYLSGILKSGTFRNPSATNFPSPRRKFFLNSHYLVVAFYCPQPPAAEAETGSENDKKDLDDYFVCSDAFLPISSLLSYRLNFGLFKKYQELLSDENSGREMPSKFELYNSRCMKDHRHHSNNNNFDNDKDAEDEATVVDSLCQCSGLHFQETTLTKMIEVMEMDSHEKSVEDLKKTLGQNIGIKIVESGNTNNDKRGKKKKKR